MNCIECGDPAEHQHHVVPESRGGKYTVPLCIPCHQKVHDLREGWGKPAYLHPMDHYNIKTLAEAGCTAKSISDDLKIGYNVVCRVIKEAGITLPKGRRPHAKNSLLGRGEPTGRHGVSDVSIRIAERAMKVAVSKQILERGEKQRYISS